MSNLAKAFSKGGCHSLFLYMLAKILETINKNAFLIVLMLLVSFFSFQLGRISSPPGSGPIKIQNAAIREILTETQNPNYKIQSLDSENRGVEKIDFHVVVSKNGSKYHFLWCSGAKQIKEENKVYFNSEEEAVAAGYTLAANCSK